jgi:hypothetical protein
MIDDDNYRHHIIYSFIDCVLESLLLGRVYILFDLYNALTDECVGRWQLFD